nr:3939_t:CDS:10 [Entrophospora candida]
MLISSKLSSIFFKNNNYQILICRNYVSASGRKPLFDKILIANRGEIACRIMKTANKLGIKSVCVYSEADKNALHVKMADEAYFLGPAASSESYLNIEKIINIAKKSDAQAIHPGYGFLSENPNFAKRLAEEKITFIGPPASAMISMDIMMAANVPVVPGYHGSNQDPKFLKEKASEIGYPVLIKAVKGGGGKGMRIVRNPSEFELQLESSKHEAMKSFADDQVLIEKYLLTPRHIEVQVFADTSGNVVHLFERDCSVQRRHQKILEEAPSPGLSWEIRNELGAKAIAAAKAVNYVGAGTVEFIMDNVDKKFYFMEMNTRLQVEHPVTEMITLTDLVQWQLEVASGNPLPVKQEELNIDGHSFEARIYAENPSNNFLPDPGPLLYLKTPNPSSNIRVETGFVQGDEISVYYDPMIAKLVVKGHDRTDALRILRKALDEYQVVGLNTNIEFLKRVVSHEAFINGEVETGFISEHETELFENRLEIPSNYDIIQASSLIIFNGLEELKNYNTLNLQDPFSPWNSLIAKRLNIIHNHTIKFLNPNDNNKEIQVIVGYNQDNTFDFTIIKDGVDDKPLIKFKNVIIKWDQNEQLIITDIEDRRYISRVISEKKNGNITVFGEHGKVVLKVPEPNYLKVESEKNEGSVITPMPRQTVEKGAPLIVLEAMKMEHIIKSPYSGIIEEILYNVGDLVEENKKLIKFANE